MAAIPYNGAYVQFRTTEKSQAGLLISADCLVGDAVTLVPDVGDATVVWVENRFGKRIGKLDAAGTDLYRRGRAKDWQVHALLASVYCDSAMSEVRYWGEIALLTNGTLFDECFEAFGREVATMLADGVRPAVDLSQHTLEALVAAQGAWRPSERADALKPADAVLVKRSRSLNEKLVEEARSGNPGCLAAAYITLSAVAALAVYLVLRLFVF